MSEQVHTTEQLDLQELKEEIIRKVMMLPDKDVTEMLEFVKALITGIFDRNFRSNLSKS